jgi:hypothetical protein
LNGTGAFAGLFNSSFGADGAGTLTYALAITGGNGTASGLTDTLTGQSIVLVNNAGVIEGHVGTAAGALAFTVSVNASGTVTLDQIRAVVHTSSDNPDTSEPATLSADNLITLTATITDKDGDHQSATLNIGQNLSFLDDGPSIGVVQNQQTDNNPATAPAVGTLHFTPGADGPGSTMTITANVTGLKSGGFNLVTAQSGNVLTAYQDTNGDGIHQAGEATVVFTLTVNPSAGTSGQYVFDLVTPLDPTVVDTPIGGSSSFGAGPTGFQVLDSATAQHLSVLTGYNTTGSFNEATWLSTGSLTSAMITDAGINGSTSGWGVDNNVFSGTNEFMFFDFGSGALADPDGPGGIDPSSSGASLPQISTATFDFIQYTTSDDITYVVHFVDASGNPIAGPTGFASGHIPSANMDAAGPNWTFTAPAGMFIGDIQLFTSGTGPGKVDLVSVGVQSSSLNQTPTFTVQLTDGDGDPTAIANFSVHIATGLTPFAPAAPVVLDLNGDGVHFLPMSAGVTFDYNGDGVKEATAWASPQDGILVHDANHNGTVDNASEFVFGSGGVTDLAALAAYDTNHDGQLSSADADYGSFMVWQDANSNGVVDAGEMTSLMARGITSISLSTNGVTYSTAEGDVTVAGTGTYTNANGTTGSLADASFLTGARTETGRNISANEASTAVLAAALAAAGMASQPAAASPDHSGDSSSSSAPTVAPAHNEALDPIPVDAASNSSTSSALTTTSSAAPQSAANTNSASHASDEGQSHSAPESAQAQAPTELLAGTPAPAHNAVVEVAPAAVASVGMPSAQDVAGGGAAHNAVVGAVLADALHGGGGSGLEALINSLPGHGDSALDALASQNGGGVSNADSSGVAAFTMAHMGLMLHGMTMMHQDAVQPHA